MPYASEAVTMTAHTLQGKHQLPLGTEVAYCRFPDAHNEDHTQTMDIKSECCLMTSDCHAKIRAVVFQ